MANRYINFSFELPCNRGEAELLYGIMQYDQERLSKPAALIIRELVPYFSRPGESSPEAAFTADLEDHSRTLGVECLYQAELEILRIYNDGEAPQLLALARLIARIFPQKLPLGFEFSEGSAEYPPIGFGGGYITISSSGVERASTDDLLAAALRRAGAFTFGAGTSKDRSR